MEQTVLEMKESTAVIEHIRIMQNVISRMAEQSARCKTWCITLLAALMVLPFQHDVYDNRLKHICMGIVVLFFLMDSYYLGIERAVRKKYRDFLIKLNSGCDIEKDLFEVKGEQGILKNLCQQFKNKGRGMISVSTILFYALIIVVLCIVY